MNESPLLELYNWRTEHGVTINIVLFVLVTTLAAFFSVRGYRQEKTILQLQPEIVPPGYNKTDERVKLWLLILAKVNLTLAIWVFVMCLPALLVIPEVVLISPEYRGDRNWFYGSLFAVVVLALGSKYHKMQTWGELLAKLPLVESMVAKSLEITLYLLGYAVMFGFWFRWFWLLKRRFWDKHEIVWGGRRLEYLILNTLDVYGETLHETGGDDRIISLPARRRFKNTLVTHRDKSATGLDDPEPVVLPNDVPPNSWFMCLGILKQIERPGRIIFGGSWQLTEALAKLIRKDLINYDRELTPDEAAYKENGLPVYFITNAGFERLDQLRRDQ